MKHLIKDKNIQKIIENAKKDKCVIAVGVFGSYARGEKYRDIDICIFLKPNKYSRKKLSQLRFYYILFNEKYDIQIFQQLPLYIRNRILKDAKIIYCKNEDALYDLYFDTIKKFDDYKQYYEQYLEGILYD
ncbi:nucleotidyltransferase domain-containing protein [Candidatus Woesearchaeota archaeon]|nr:nucleotidyltransferase domain-containing protein [Candidatus Woesearchaeota archaeon]